MHGFLSFMHCICHVARPYMCLMKYTLFLIFFIYAGVLCLEVIRQDIKAKGLNEGILLDRNEGRKLIHVLDSA